jgi:preprotein translocase subunit SecB
MPKKKLVKPSVPPESRVALAMAVSARVQIKAITLLSTTARRPPLGAKLPTNLELNIDVESHLDTQKQEIGVRVSCAVLGRYEEQEDTKPMLEIRADYWLLYSVATAEGLGLDNIKAFGDLNGVYNVWPYWREYVQSTVTRMGMPPLPIPVFRPLDLKPLEKTKQLPGRRPKKAPISSDQ